MVNGSTVDRFKAGGDPMVTLYHQEPDGTFKDITREAGLTTMAGAWGSLSPTTITTANLICLLPAMAEVCFTAAWGIANSRTLPRRPGSGAEASSPARLGAIMTVMVMSICSSRATRHVDMDNLPHLAATSFASLKGAGAMRPLGFGRRKRLAVPQSRRRHL